MTNQADKNDQASYDDAQRTAWLEKFRQTGISLDRGGRFWHEGAEVTHQGLRSALFRWLDTLDDGTHILRLDAKRYAYIDVEDTPLLVTSLTWATSAPIISLNDGNQEPLACDSLRIGPNNTIYCTVRLGKLNARFTTAAYYQLAERIEEQIDGSFAVVVNQQKYRLAERP